VVNDKGLVAGWQSLIARTHRHPDFPSEYTSLFKTDGKLWLEAISSKGRFVLGIDCEMVYAKDDRDALARVSVVNCSGVIYDAHVTRKPEDVLDYRSRISGVEPQHLLPENGALSFAEVQKQVLKLISLDTILVGHSLHKDLRALKIQHLKIVDTALIFGVEGGSHRRKHKLNSLVTLMRPKVVTLEPVKPGAHDPRQDAQWALQLALYEASIHPRLTKPLRLLSFPKTLFLTEIPKGTSLQELQALFARGTCAEVSYHLQIEASKDQWLGTSTVTFGSQAERDAAFAALARFVRVYVGPLRDWNGRTDTAKMQSALLLHFAKYGQRQVAGVDVFCKPGNTRLGLMPLHVSAAPLKSLMATDYRAKFLVLFLVITGLQVSRPARALAALLVLRASPSAGAEELAEELEATMAKFDFDRDGSLNKKEALSWYRLPVSVNQLVSSFAVHAKM
ncbi:unnamed protein product, partial [Polarella glacialis]